MGDHQQAAEYYQLDPKTIRRMIARGKLKARPVGERSIRVDRLPRPQYRIGVPRRPRRAAYQPVRSYAVSQRYGWAVRPATATLALNPPSRT
jgi:hypothetical protein